MSCSNFCILPFTHLSTRVDGNVAPCCRSMDTVGSIKENTISEIWNNDNMKRLRQQFMNNERPEGCWPCWQLEDQGSKSMRQSMNDTRKDMMPVALTQEMPFEIPVLELKLSNLCNFRCRTCKPDLSTTWMKDWEKVKSEYESVGMVCKTGRQENYDNDKFLEDIVRLGPSLEVIEFAGGEPLMDPMHYKVLDALQPFASNIQVKYSTNLSRLTYGRYNALEAWTKFKGVDISLSIDGYPELNEYIRTEANTQQLKTNLLDVKKELGDKFIGRAALCYSAWNVIGLPESYDYFTFDLGLVVHGNIAWAPQFINPQVLPLELKKQVTQKYLDYANKAKEYKIKGNNRRRIDRFINTNMNFLNAEDRSQDFEQFIRYSKKLDESRQTNIFEVIPELEKYV